MGDPVFGTPEPAVGAHAQYICIPEDGVLAQKPANVSFAEAATFPGAANTALHFLRDMGHVRAGQAVLINGASGAIGTFAVQLAKHFGAQVTGVCSTANLALVASLGADHCVDYTRADFTKTGRSYDAILDAVGKSSFARCKPALKAGGIYLTTVPHVSALLQAQWTSITGGKRVRVEGAPAKLENLHFLKALIEAGQLKAVIDRSYPLEQTADAFRYVEQGHKQGNVVITVAHDAEN